MKLGGARRKPQTVTGCWQTLHMQQYMFYVSVITQLSIPGDNDLSVERANENISYLVFPRR